MKNERLSKDKWRYFRSFARNFYLLALICVHVKEAFLGVIAALVQSVASEFLVAFNAEELYYTGKELPEEVLPGYLFGSKGEHKFVEIEVFVGDVWCLDFSVAINENLTFVTELPASLTSGEELAAVGAPLQHVLVVLE